MTRDDVQALLPFLANDTLAGDERAEVEAAVAADAELQAELAALRAIRETMQADEIDYSPGEMGLARLMRDVDAEAAPVVQRSGIIHRPWLWQSVAAVLLAVVVGQAAFQLGSPETGDTFTLASGEEPGSALSGAQLSVTFDPDVTEQALRALLLQAGVEIAAGPSEQGLYQLALHEGVTLDAALAALAAADAVASLEVLEN